MADTPGILQPAIDARTGALTTKSVSRTATYGRTAFVGTSLDIPVNKTMARLLRFPFPIDLVEGFLLNEQAARAALGDDTAGFEIAPRTDLSIFTGGGNVLAVDVAKNDQQITLIPGVLAAAVSVALLDSGFFRVEIEEAGLKEAAIILVTDYDDAPGGGTGIVNLGTFHEWTEGEAEPAWTGFANDYTTAAKVFMTRIGVSSIPMVGDGAVKFGSYGLDSAPIAANVLLRFPYTNVSAAQARTMRVVLHIETGKPLPP